MDYLQKIITDIELHSVEGIKDCFENGIDPNDYFRGKPLIYELLSEYQRGPAFKECVKMFVQYGLSWDDNILLAVLMDDADLLHAELSRNADAVRNTYTFDCAFTPLAQASPLHICAEYNHLACMQVLLNHGAEVNEPAGIDANGFGGQTPIFHTVNQHRNRSMDALKCLLDNSADLTLTVKGIIWGKGYDWETFVPAVNPISYAMMGLLPQFQRTEPQIYEVISMLLKAAYRIDYVPPNVPNKYLIKKGSL